MTKSRAPRRPRPAPETAAQAADRIEAELPMLDEWVARGTAPSLPAFVAFKRRVMDALRAAPADADPKPITDAVREQMRRESQEGQR